jgi:hypothetical protein
MTVRSYKRLIRRSNRTVRREKGSTFVRFKGKEGWIKE